MELGPTQKRGEILQASLFMELEIRFGIATLSARGFRARRGFINFGVQDEGWGRVEVDRWGEFV